MNQNGDFVVAQKLLEKAKLIIFDMDGTIVASGTVWAAALALVLQFLGLSDVDCNFPRGTNMLDKWRYIVEKNNLDLRLTTDELAGMTLLQVAALFNEGAVPGFKIFVAGYKANNPDVKFVLATNANRYITLFILMHLEALNLFDLVVTMDDMEALDGLPKPAPDMFEHASEIFNCKPAECLVIGDTNLDADAALAAKMPYILIGDGSFGSFPSGSIFLPDFVSLVTPKGT